MGRNRARTGTALLVSAIVAAGTGVAGTPASAHGSGLRFYSGTFATEVAHLRAPTGACAALPPTADSHVGWDGFTDVVFYRTADCTGPATGMGTLRTYGAGLWQSFLAS